MKTNQINQILNQINSIPKPPALASVQAFPCDSDGSLHSDESIQSAIDAADFWISLDIVGHRTYSAADESERDRAMSDIVASVEAMQGVVSVTDEGGIDSLEGPGRCFRVEVAQ